MRKFLTERRLNRLKKALLQRQLNLGVAIENVHDPHNVSAIFRTCDAVGVPKVSLIYTEEKFPKISKITSASALKWVEKQKYQSVNECFDEYRKEGFKIFSSLLDENSVNLYDIDFTEKCLVVFGNENRGISGEVVEQSDETFYIPMHGMVQSLNVSVAAAVTLYEIQRQRVLKGMYENTSLSEDDFEALFDEWAAR